MTGPFHTITYPTSPGALPQEFAFPPKTPNSVRRYAFDFSKFAADAGTTVASAFLLADPSLTVAGVSTQGNQVQFTVAGGSVSTPLPVISFAILLADGQREDATVVQPIDPLAPPVPAGAIAVGSQPLTLDHVPLDVSQMVPVPGGVQAGDAVLLYRAGSPSAVYLASPAGLGGGGGGVGGLINATAGASISGHRAIMVNAVGLAVHADPIVPFAFLGISTGAASSGAIVDIAPAGSAITEPSWAWAPGSALYVGGAGLLTATPPTSGVLQQVAEALSATTILVQPYQPIRLT